MKKSIKKFRKHPQYDVMSCIIILVSFLTLIIGSFAIGFFQTFFIVLVLDLICFYPKLKSYYFTSQKKTAVSSHTRTGKTIKKSQQKSLIKKVLFIGLSAIIIGIFCVIIFFLFIIIKAPGFDAAKLYSLEPTTIYDKDGEEIAKLGSEQRILIDYEEIPEVLIDAIIATEDSRFFQHNGVDWARFLKASLSQLAGQSDAGGASTLTMQVSKNSIVQDKTAHGIKGIIRKFTDVYISMFKIEPNYTKEEIMEFYVNSYFLGNNSYGVEQAAMTYFNKSAKDLNLSEAAFIAGLFQAPSKYNPYDDTKKEAAEKRRQTVLYLMKRHGYITDEEYDIAIEQTVDKIIAPRDGDTYQLGVNEYQSFVDVVVKEVKNKTGLNPYEVPMEIYTTMDTKAQEKINDIMNGKTFKWENDVVQAGIAITNINDGSIVAIGGGRNLNAIGTNNHATDIRRQIGSTAKPLYDYGPAVEYLGWSPATIDPDEKITYSDGKEINNYDGHFQGIETIRTALGGSRNIPALKAFQANSKENIREFVTNLGLSPESYLHEAHSIGGYTGENPLSMAVAYAAFGNGGYYIKPYSTTKIIVQTTGEVYENKLEKDRVMSDSTAFIITDMLKTTAKTGVTMGGYYNIKGVTYAAKSGTTNFDEATLKAKNFPSSAVNDVWVVGFDANYAIGVWYGYDDNNSGFYTKASTQENKKIFQAAGKAVFSKEPQTTVPDSVTSVTVEVDEPRNCLPSEFTPSDMRLTEYFVKGTEPECTSSRYEKLSNPANVNAHVNNGIINITWTSITTPNIMTESYLKTYYKSVFKSDSGLNSYIASRMNYNSSVIGDLGYDIYLENSTGQSQNLGFTTANVYSYPVTETGIYTFTVKSSYSIFKANASDGKKVSVTVNQSDLATNILPAP